MPEQKTNQITLIIGRKGTGKTYFVQNSLTEIQPFILVDSLSEYEGFTVYETFDDFLNEIETNGVASCITRFTTDAENEALFDFAFSFSPHTLVIEEINKYCSSAWASDELIRLIRYGRHRQINIVGVTQRPYDLPKLLTSQVDVWELFQIVEPRDIDYLEKATGQTLRYALPKLSMGKRITLDMRKGVENEAKLDMVDNRISCRDFHPETDEAIEGRVTN